MAVKFLTGVDLQSQRGINFADPSSLTDAATKAYVDNLVAGLSFKDEVRVATTTNGTLATAYANGQTIDGVVLATGNRILLKDQTTQTENGLYTTNVSGAPTRTTDADTTAELTNATVFVTDGTVNSGFLFTQTTKNPVIATSNIVFVRFASGITYTAGNGLQLSSNAFSILLDTASGLSVSGTGLKVNSTIAGAGLTFTSGVLDVVGGTGITVAADLVSIDTSVVDRHYVTSIGDGTLTSYVVTHNLGTKDVGLTIRSNSTDERVETDWVSTSTNTLTVTFATAPSTNAYRVKIDG